jgi:hypothetical protein
VFFPSSGHHHHRCCSSANCSLTVSSSGKVHPGRSQTTIIVSFRSRSVSHQLSMSEGPGPLHFKYSAQVERILLTKKTTKDRASRGASRQPQSARAVISEARIVLYLCSPKKWRGATHMARYGGKAAQKVKKAMHERKRGTLKSGRSGKKVTSRKQAVAIGLSEARRAGGKVPRKKSKKK